MERVGVAYDMPLNPEDRSRAKRIVEVVKIEITLDSDLLSREVDFSSGKVKIVYAGNDVVFHGCNGSKWKFDKTNPTGYQTCNCTHFRFSGSGPLILHVPHVPRQPRVDTGKTEREQPRSANER